MSYVDKKNVRDKIFFTSGGLALEDLYCKNRLQTESMTPLQWLLFILYLPFGCVLAVTRFALVFILAFITPEKFRYLVFRYIGGLRCKTTGKLSIPDKNALIVVNHTNYLDSIVTNAALAQHKHLGTVIWHGVNFLSRAICRPTVSVMDKGKNCQFIQQLDSACESHSMVVFPEGAVTDSITGLLQFQHSIFQLQKPIYLMAINYERAFPFLRGKAMSREMGLEVLVDLFQPWTNVELIPLGEFKRENINCPMQQADAAQKVIANALGLSATRWSKNDRHKYLFERA